VSVEDKVLETEEHAREKYGIIEGEWKIRNAAGPKKAEKE